MVARDCARPFLVPDARDFPSGGGLQDKLQFMLQYAVAAPSSHNTQPWKFAIVGDEVHLYPDASRWLKVSDPDRRELYISLGCALENLAVAAARFGFKAGIQSFPGGAGPLLAASVTITPDNAPDPLRPRVLFDAIGVRRTNHDVYRQEPIPEEDLHLLRRMGAEQGVVLYLTDDRDTIFALDQLVVRADALLFANPHYREELGYWIGQGVFGAPWLIAKLSRLAVTYLDLGGAIGCSDSRLLMSAPLFGCFLVDRDEPAAQMRAGQALERLWLAATALGIALQPLSLLLQPPPIRKEVEALIGADRGRPIQPFRLGFATEDAPPTPRRPLEEMLI